MLSLLFELFGGDNLMDPKNNLSHTATISRSFFITSQIDLATLHEEAYLLMIQRRDCLHFVGPSASEYDIERERIIDNIVTGPLDMSNTISPMETVYEPLNMVNTHFGECRTSTFYPIYKKSTKCKRSTTLPKSTKIRCTKCPLIGRTKTSASSWEAEMILNSEESKTIWPSIGFTLSPVKVY